MDLLLPQEFYAARFEKEDGARCDQSGTHRGSDVQSISRSDVSTNELVEAAVAEMEKEDSQKNGKPPLGPASGLEKQVSGTAALAKVLEEAPSPIRVTPAASRQAGFSPC